MIFNRLKILFLQIGRIAESILEMLNLFFYLAIYVSVLIVFLNLFEVPLNLDISQYSAVRTIGWLLIIGAGWFITQIMRNRFVPIVKVIKELEDRESAKEAFL